MSDKIDYEYIKLDYAAKNVYEDENFIEIRGLDGSCTKIHKNYLHPKYIIKEETKEEE